MYPHAFAHRRGIRAGWWAVAAAAAVAPALGNNNLSLINSPTGDFRVTAGPDYFAFDDSAILRPTTIQTALALSNVSAHTGTNGANTEPGDIFLSNNIAGPGNGFGFTIAAARNITGTATVDTSGATAAGGFITLMASAGAITVSDLRARGTSGTSAAFNAGAISLTAATGISAGTLRADSTSGNGASSAGANIILSTNGGNVSANSLFAETDATTSNFANAGNISVTAAAGTISFAGQLSTAALSSSGSRNAGAITVRASGALTLSDQVTANSFIGIGAGNSASGGAITLRASQITAANLINSSSEVDSSLFTVSGNAGNAGSIGLTATAGSIAVGGLLSAYSHSKSGSAGSGGVIIAVASGAATFAGVAVESKVRSSGSAGAGGNITLAPAGNLTITGDVTAYSLSPSGATGIGGNVSLSGSSVSAGNIYTYSDATSGASGRAGNVTITANGAISASSIFAYARSSNTTAGGGGNIAVTSTASSVTVATLDSSSTSIGGSAGTGGSITIIAGSTLDITSSAKTSSTSLVNPSSTAGNMTLSAPTQVHLNSADAHSTNSVGGTISITSNEINLGPGSVSANAIQSNGPLILQPAAPGQNVNIGNASDSGGASLDLLATDLGCLATGFSSITIGRADSSGVMTISPTTFHDPTTLRMPSGAINLTNGTLAGTGNSSLTLAAPDITFSGSSPAITTQSRPITISGAVHLASDASLNSAATGSGAPINVNGSLDGAGGLMVTGGGTWMVANLNIGSLTVASGTIQIAQNGNFTAAVSSLSIASGAKLDLYDNDLVINYTGPTPAPGIRALLISGFNLGDWGGPGLASLAAHSDPSMRTALGYNDTGSQIVVKYTYYGDANLDGTVDAADFAQFLDGYAGGGASWSQGDFTYDGVVDLGNDFNLFLDSYLNHGQPLSALAAEIDLSPALSAAQRAVLLSSVPEPAAGAFVLAGALLTYRQLNARRRRVPIRRSAFSGKSTCRG